jgi:uncharacterized protein YyaL (SSP411 family)
VSSQVWADAVLLTAQVTASGPGERTISGALALDRSVERETRCQLEKSIAFLERMVDRATGGFYARTNSAGTAVERGPRFVDDNALVGLTLLAAAEVVADIALARRYTALAEGIAAFLTGATGDGPWDERFGGGFWWNTGRGDSAEGKPTQANTLAALMFGRLYRATGAESYRIWALRTLAWLDEVLFDRDAQLYRWSMAYAEPARREGTLRSDRFFNYDQALAIEAQLMAAELDGDGARVERARAIGRAIHPAFWAPQLGGYTLEARVPQLFTSYGAWTSLGHLALYDRDGDPYWLDLARANATTLTETLGEPDGGIAYRSSVGPKRPGFSGRPHPDVIVDHIRDTSAQAWTQHLQAALAQRLVSSA